MPKALTGVRAAALSPGAEEGIHSQQRRRKKSSSAQEPYICSLCKLSLA